MRVITVSLDRKTQIIESHREWMRTLPRQEGQVGGSIVSLVEGGQTATTISFYQCDPEFIKYLKKKNIPFT
jgi:hypothetical protein